MNLLDLITSLESANLSPPADPDEARRLWGRLNPMIFDRATGYSSPYASYEAAKQLAARFRQVCEKIERRLPSAMRILHAADLPPGMVSTAHMPMSIVALTPAAADNPSATHYACCAAEDLPPDCPLVGLLPADQLFIVNYRPSYLLGRVSLDSGRYICPDYADLAAVKSLTLSAGAGQREARAKQEYDEARRQEADEAKRRWLAESDLKGRLARVEAQLAAVAARQ